MTPYNFTARMVDGTLRSQGNKPIMIPDSASAREIEQTILECAEQHGEVLSVRWHVVSDYNL